MLIKRLLLAVIIAALFGLVSKSYAEEPTTQQAPITIDALTGKITVHPAAPATPESRATAGNIAKPPIGASTESEKVKPVEKPKVVEIEQPETDRETTAETPEISSSEPVEAGKEERASFDVPANGTLFHEGNCVGVMEDGKFRACRYEDTLKK